MRFGRTPSTGNVWVEEARCRVETAVDALPATALADLGNDPGIGQRAIGILPVQQQRRFERPEE